MTYIQQINDWLSNHKSTTLPNWLTRNNEIKNWVELETSQYTTKNIMERVYIILNGPQPKCEYNNPRQFNTFELGYRKGCILGNKCKCVTKYRRENQIKTLQERYGVTTTGQVPGSLEKRKKTTKDKYGVEFAMHSTELKNKLKTTVKNRTQEQKQQTREKTTQSFINKYGEEHHMKIASQREKVYNTNPQKYNAKVPLQNETILKKALEKVANRPVEETQDIVRRTKETLFETYGVTAASRIPICKSTLEILDNAEKFKKFITNKTRKEVLELLKIADNTLYLYAKKHDALELFKRDSGSEPEREINEYVKSLGIITEVGDRKILNGKEIDILIPNLNIGIEHCGLYYHSEFSPYGVDRNYHYNKHIQCKNKGIKLITIFGDEWQYKQEQVKHRLTYILNKSQEKIHARKCILKEIKVKQAKTFVEKYHIQGYCSAKIKLGLFYNNELVAVMTFGKPRFNKSFQHELLRFCSKVPVIGGASKLFQYFIKNYNPLSILSYSDNRWGDGNLYNNLNMTKINDTVGFYVTDYQYRYHRTKFQKHKLIQLGGDPKLTAKTIIKSKKLDYIWDCGQSTWSWIK